MSTNEALPPSRHAQEAKYPGLSFITFLDPGESKLPSQRKAVRSHAALYQASKERITHESQPQKKRQRKRKRKALAPGELVILSLDPTRTPLHEGRGIFLSAQVPDNHAISRLAHQFSSPRNGLLGAGRVDPFRTYPIPWEPFIPELVDHCSYSFIALYKV
jgi:hypothetical protein